MSTRNNISSAIAIAFIAGGALVRANTAFAQAWAINGADLFANPTTTRVGIGRNNPQVPLHLQTLGTIQLRLEDQNGSFDLQGGGDFNILRAGTNWLQFNTANTFIKLGPNNEFRLNTTSGNLGIGTTAPGGRIEASSASTSEPQLKATSTNNSDWARVVINGNGNAFTLSVGSPASSTPNVFNIYHPTSGNILSVTSGGKVGLGTTSPTHLLQLATDDAAKPSTNTWTIVSDARLKTDIAPFTDGLDVIRQINPITYRYNGQAGTPAGEKCIGILAQDMEKIAPYTIRKFRAKLNPGDAEETELLGYNHHGIEWASINAIKQLDAENMKLALENSEMRTRLDEQAARIARLEGAINGLSSVPTENNGSASATLGQNDPNPTNDMTTIPYTLPETASRGEIVISELGSGREVTRIALTTRGRGEIAVPVKDILSGNYIYSLIVDGKVMASRKMIVVK